MHRENDGEGEENVSVFHADHFLASMGSCTSCRPRVAEVDRDSIQVVSALTAWFTERFLIVLGKTIGFATKKHVFTTGSLVPRTRRGDLMLDLKWPMKRHSLIFAGTQRYADEQGWESIIDEYAAELLADGTTKTTSLPYDGVIGRVTANLAEYAMRLKFPLVRFKSNWRTWTKNAGVWIGIWGSGTPKSAPWTPTLVQDAASMGWLPLRPTSVTGYGWRASLVGVCVPFHLTSRDTLRHPPVVKIPVPLKMLQ